METTNDDTLRAYYEDWYRPELMAVIAVGDFDAEQVKTLITERFSALEGLPSQPVRHDVTVGHRADPAFERIVDPDISETFVDIMYPLPERPLETLGDVRDVVGVSLAFDMIATRLTDDVTRGDAPFFFADWFELDLARPLEVFGLTADSNPEDLAASTEALLVEVERVRRHGFTDLEFTRALEARRTQAEQDLAGVETTQDLEYALSYVNNFLAQEPIPSSQELFAALTVAFDDLTPGAVHALFVDLADSSAPAVLVAGPEGDDQVIPSTAELAEIVARVASTDIGPRPAAAQAPDSLMLRPDGVEPADRGGVSVLDITVLHFANGARVVFLPTAIADNTVILSASSSGGTSVIDDGALTEANLSPQIIMQSGVGGFDQVTLDRFLSDKVVFVFPFVDQTREGWFGSAATEDLEALFQLVHLYMTMPRADEAAERVAVESWRQLAESPEENPDLASAIVLLDARYVGSPRFDLVPSLDDLDTFDLDLSLDLFRDRFGDAGDFDTEVIEQLAAAYIGTLPGTRRDDMWIDHQPEHPQGAVTRTVEVGEGAQAFVNFLVTGHLDASFEERVHLGLLELILNARLREALSATYSPFVSIESTDEPDAIVETFISVSGSPDRLDEISGETLAVLQAMAGSGPTEAELATAREQLIRQFELISNEFWTDTLLFYAHRPDESILDLVSRIEIAATSTVIDIRRVADAAFPDGRYIEVRQLPE